MDAVTQALLDGFGHRPTVLVFPGTPEYFAELAVYWNAANQETKPKVIVKPKTSADLSKAIKLLAAHKAEFAIRSGGGTPIPTANNTTGVLIALRDLNAEIEFPNEGVVSLGPGLRWGEVYRALLPRGETVVGGRIPPVGVGGLLLGGGFSHLSHEHGMSCDNVVNYEVVLASGEVVEANSAKNADLFWALKGGTNNFGVVSRFDVKLISQKDGIWGGMIVVGPDHINEALKAFYEWQIHDQPKDAKAATQAIVIKGAGMGSKDAAFATIVVCYAAPVENPECLRRLTSLPSIHSTLRFTTHLGLCEELGVSFDCNKRHIFHTGSYKASPDLTIACKDIFEEAVAETGLYDKDEASYNTLTFQPVSKSMLSHGEGLHAMDIKSSEAPFTWYIAAIQYSSAAFDEILQKAAESGEKKTEARARELDKHVPFLYLNDAAGGQNPLQTYGADSLRRMQEVRQKYDPDGVFTKLCSGGFKLGE